MFRKDYKILIYIIFNNLEIYILIKTLQEGRWNKRDVSGNYNSRKEIRPFETDKTGEIKTRVSVTIKIGIENNRYVLSSV
jgi:hypothetical protein